MEYRSEVAIKCEPNAFEKLMGVCKEHNMEPDSVITDGKYKILYWDWIKWYSDFEEVKAIHRCMRWLDENHEYDENDGLGYRFLRLGEDDSDVDDDTNDYDIELYYVRKIELPEPQKKQGDVFGTWIPVSERLPSEEGNYVVWTKTKLGGAKSFNKAGFRHGEWYGSGGRWTNVTHWMPLPDDPNNN